MSESDTTLFLDACQWTRKDDFYRAYAETTKAPKWFGKNLDAFRDSLRGGICKITPEKIVIHNLSSTIKEKMGLSFWSAIEEICIEEEVNLLGTFSAEGCSAPC